jgi:hypothetical protein
VAHFSIEKWHIFHFDVLFSNGSQGYFFDYKLVNIWLDKITSAQNPWTKTIFALFVVRFDAKMPITVLLVPFLEQHRCSCFPAVPALQVTMFALLSRRWL